jgi:TolB-like protein/Flp pilus assembly protein TadD
VPYMSPEQAASRPLEYRSDQFSFGSILYEMATGKRAFKRDTVPETLAAIIEDEPEPIWKLNEAVPDELVAIVERCLAKDPAGRYASTGDLAKELKAVPETPPVWRTQRKVLWGAGAVVVVLLAVALGPNLKRLSDQLTTRAGPAPIESIAVLPLRNLSGDPEQEYFADGMTEALITDLAKVSGLRVIAPHSAMRYKGTDIPLSEVARELGVDALVEGSALRAGDTVRIMAQLIDPKTEQALWAESYERTLENVLVLQGEVARAIAGELAVSLTPEEASRLAAARPVNPEAYDAYLKGSYHWKNITPEDLDSAQRYFELALEKDPSYAPAYEGLTLVWVARAVIGVTPPDEAWSRAEAAARRAIELDDRSAAAHVALAMVRWFVDWDWAGSETEFRRALELEPNSAETHAYYGNLLMITGRIDEAFPHLERALEKDPLNVFVRSLYANVLYMDGRYDDALIEVRTALGMQPDATVALSALYDCLYLKRTRDEDLVALRERVAHDPEFAAAFDQGLAEAGYRGALRRVAGRLAARWEESGGVLDHPLAIQDIAVWYMYAGDHDRAMDWLEKMAEIRDPSIFAIFFPVFDPMRSDPRFQDLLRRMNLPTERIGSDGDIDPSG